MNGCSAVTLAVLRWDARGAATASGSVMPRSSRLVSVCRTVVMMVEPPGEPSARNGLPPRSTIVGDIDDRGRLPGWIRFGSACVVDRGEVGQLVVQQEAAARAP